MNNYRPLKGCPWTELVWPDSNCRHSWSREARPVEGSQDRDFEQTWFSEVLV